MNSYGLLMWLDIWYRDDVCWVLIMDLKPIFEFSFKTYLTIEIETIL